MASYAEKRTAIRRALVLMRSWDKKVPYAFAGGLPRSIEAMEEVLAEYGQMRLPWEGTGSNEPGNPSLQDESMNENNVGGEGLEPPTSSV